MNLLQLGSTSLGGGSCLFAVPFVDVSQCTLRWRDLHKTWRNLPSSGLWCRGPCRVYVCHRRDYPRGLLPLKKKYKNMQLWYTTQVKRELWTVLIRNMPRVFDNTQGDYAYTVLVRHLESKRWTQLGLPGQLLCGDLLCFLFGFFFVCVFFFSCLMYSCVNIYAFFWVTQI